MPKTVAEIDAEIQKLKAKKAQMVARETAEQRRARTRQAAILGGWLMANEPATVERIKSALTRPQDRKAFGLDELPGDQRAAA